MPAATKPQPSADAKLYISASLPVTEDEAGYAALSFTEIKEVVNIGEFSRTYNLIAVNSLGQRQTRNLKGSFTEGTPPVQLNYAPGDPGQQLLLTALQSDNDYSFKIELNDGTIFYNQGLVSQAPISLGGVDELVSMAATLTFNGIMVVDYPA